MTAALGMGQWLNFHRRNWSMSLVNVKRSYFDARQQARLDADDTEAFSAVATILLCIVSAGLVLGVISVLAILATS